MNTNKIDLIRAEVERLQNELIQEKEKGFGSDTDDACILELQNVLTYIDSLQEDIPPLTQVNSISSQTEEGRGVCSQQEEFSIVIVLNGQRHRQVLHKGCFSKKECKEKCSLYERCQRCCIDLCMIFFHDPHCHFVEEPISEDLEKEVNKYSSCIYLEEVLSDDDKEVLKERLINTFKAGAEWQKEKDVILPKVWNRKNLDDFSYQTAYDLSNDWAKETPTWDDVEKACKLGSEWQKERDQKSMEIMDEVYFKSCDMIRKQMIAKACKYLQDHREEVETEDNGIAGWISNEFIEKFSKYLEE